MDALTSHRAALQELIARGQGERRGSPRFLAQERRGLLAQAEVLGLPEAPVPAVQNQAVGTPGFGAFLFMLDYDKLP